MDDVVVGGKFKIGMKIGSGSYGVIHEGVNIESGEKVAIKLEPANTEYPLLEHESDIYKHLDGGPGIPKLKWFGVEGEHNIMVIDLLGQSLADLMESSGPLDMKTVLILAVQLILTLEYIHSRGVIHRDIKPDNLLMGLGSNAHQVYLVDFGLAGYYIDPSSDEHIEYRESNGFVGTYRYASMFSHYGIEQSRRDDLHSLGYVLLYLLGGSLPWQGLSAERDQEELHRLYYEKKSEILVQELCKSCPWGFKRYFLVCRYLSFYEETAYRLFRSNFLDDFEDLGLKSDYIYYMPDALKNKNRNRIGAGNEETDRVDSISRLLENKILYLVPDPPEYGPPENRNRIASPAPSAVAQQPPLQQSPVQAQPTPVQPAQQQVAAPPPSQKTVPVARNGFGTMGKKCVIRANHFLVNFGDKDPHQYDVTITPEVISKRKSREILQLLINLYKQSHLGNMLLAYDGKKRAFAAGPLPFESKEFVVKLTESNGREKEFKVNLKFAARKDLHHLRQFLAGRQHDNPHETIQALDVVLREAASTGREILGRSLFSAQFGSGVLGDGIEYWKGFYQSLRPTQMGLSLNIDMSARAFYEPKLVTEFVSDFLMKDLMRPLSDQERIKVKRILRGVRVEVRRPDYMRRYKVQALTVQPTNQLTDVSC